MIDTLAHPTLTGTWLHKKTPSSFQHLVSELHKNNYTKALAIGMHGVEGYDHKKFIHACEKYPELIPIAGFDPNIENVEKEMLAIRKMGFTGIKIHPRFSRMSYKKNQLRQILRSADKHNLVVLYCTYAHCSAPHYPEIDPFYTLAKAINSSPSTKIVLVHGGDVSLLKYAELARFNDNILIDLSLTIMKYVVSSIDNDIQFLFRYFDRKITIGTDYPEYSHKQVRDRFDHFSKGLSEEKKNNIAHKNIQTLIENLR